MGVSVGGCLREGVYVCGCLREVGTKDIFSAVIFVLWALSIMYAYHYQFKCF